MKVQANGAERIATAPAHYRRWIGESARFAVIRGARTTREVEAYLPGNYTACESFVDEHGLAVIIGGLDDAGWTLDSYVLPRLASGLFFGKEIY